MADERQGDFPIVGERVTALDGSTWTYEGEGVWTQGTPALSEAELAARDAAREVARQRVSRANRLWSLAWAHVRVARPIDALTSDDAPEAFALCVAHGELVDALVLYLDGREASFAADARAIARQKLGDPEWGSMNAFLSHLRDQIETETMPDRVAARARPELAKLGEFLARLRPDGAAAAILQKITSVDVAKGKAPDATLPDQLFRHACEEGLPVQSALELYRAAAGYVGAFR